MTLRTSLLLLTLAVLLPALLLMATLAALFVREERAATGAGLANTAGALAESIDAHVVDALNSLTVLAQDGNLLDDDLAGFRAEAAGAVATQPGWTLVYLVRPDGRQILNTGIDGTAPLPSAAGTAPFETVRATGQPYVAHEIQPTPGGDRPRLSVALPVRRGDDVAYVLVAVLDPRALNGLFERQRLSAGWYAMVLDRRYTVVLCPRDGDDAIGTAAPPELVATIADATTGEFDMVDANGQDVVGAAYRSDLTGWTLVLQSPKTAILGSVSHTVLLIVGGGILLVATGVVLSTRMGQRIERATRSLLIPARRLASGQPPLTRPRAALREIEFIGQEMDRAAGLLEQRNRQQAALGALALKAVTVAERGEFFDEVLKTVTATLEVEFCDLLEYEPGEDGFLLRAGIGWQPGRVGTTRIPNRPDLLPGHVWASGGPVFYRDLINEQRFGGTGLLQELGAVSGMAVPIQGPETPYGILGVHSANYREFGESEANFAAAIANVVSAFLYRSDTERRLADSERRIMHFVASMNAVPYRYDVDARRYTFVGPQSLRLLGFTPEEWGTEGWWGHQLHPDDRDAALAEERKCTERGEDYVLEYRMINREGRIVWIRDIVRVEIAENGHKMLYGMAIDITAAKEREQQLAEAQKLQAVGQLTGGVAHDFNNLLAIIIGTCELVTEQAQGDPALMRTIAQIGAAADRGAALTQRLLAFSRKQALNPAIVDLNGLVRGIQPLLERTLGPNIRIRTDLAPDLGHTLADAGQLENVLVNLALNARDAMPEGGEVVVSTQNASIDAQGDLWSEDLPSGYYVVLSVADTGAGMSPAVKSRAFEPFFTTKPTGKGSGLGLSTVYGFVKQSGGSVSIDSQPGRGTIVRVCLPRVEPSETAPSAAPETEARGCNETILVVEDDPSVRNVVAGMVESLGYQVLEAESGSDALALLETGEPVDLVLTDVVMPGAVDGWKLAQAIWQRWPRTRVLLTTGYSDNVLVRHATLDERTQVLSKPYRRNELSKRLRDLLDS